MGKIIDKCFSYILWLLPKLMFSFVCCVSGNCIGWFSNYVSSETRLNKTLGVVDHQSVMSANLLSPSISFLSVPRRQFCFVTVWLIYVLFVAMSVFTADNIFGGDLFRVVISHMVSRMVSGTELCQFLIIVLPTLLRNPIKCWRCNDKLSAVISMMMMH